MTASPGKYVVIEGHDGTGKSTQVSILRQRLAEQGIESIEFHEPEGTPVADAIRTVIKNGELKRDGETNVWLFTAARHDIWQQYALPALSEGKWVVASRNYFSTLAYQGSGEGIDWRMIRSITRMATDSRYLRPDIAVILELDGNERKKRIAKRGKLEKPDTFESKGAAFQQRVENAYHGIARRHHAIVISADGSVDEVADRIWETVKPSVYARSGSSSKFFRFSATIKSLLTE